MRAEANVRAGDGKHQIDQHAAIQRKFANGFGFDDFADTGISCVQDFAGRSYADALGDGSELERNIQGKFLADFETDGLRGGGETGGVSFELVFVGKQCGKFKEALIVGDDVTDAAGGYSGELDGGSHNGEMLGIGDGASDGRVVALGTCGRDDSK